MVSALNAGQHNAVIFAYATPVFDGAARTRTARVVCIHPGWGRCPLQGEPVPVNGAWRPSPGSDGSMVVIDYALHEVYDVWQVKKRRGGAIAVFGDGSIHVGWGDLTGLYGFGQSRGATGSGLSHLYGMIRVFEARNAVRLGGCSPKKPSCPLASAIPHALHIATDITCPTYRSPAIKSDGTSSNQNCVPMGARVFLDGSANCAFNRHAPIEEAVCYALKRYGAFVTDTSAARFTIGFEGSSAGEPGGSGPSPYHAGGIRWDYYNMSGIPWSRLHVSAG
jgi:hypothetical protein